MQGYHIWRSKHLSSLHRASKHLSAGHLCNRKTSRCSIGQLATFLKVGALVAVINAEEGLATGDERRNQELLLGAWAREALAVELKSIRLRWCGWTGGWDLRHQFLRGGAIGEGSHRWTSRGRCEEDECERTNGGWHSVSLDLRRMSWRTVADCCFPARNFSTTIVTESSNRPSLEMGENSYPSLLCEWEWAKGSA